MSDYESLNEEQRKVWDAAKASDHWMRQYELKAKDEIAFLVEDAIANASDYWLRQYELKDKELLKAKDEITELKRRLLDNGVLCTLRVKLTAETCQETIKRLREDNERLWEDNERLSALLRSTEHNHAWRVVEDPQA